MISNKTTQGAMYYIIKKDGKHTIKEVKNSTDATYQDLQKQGHILCGQFGRKDFAEKWRDFHNGDITRQELNNYLNLF